MVFMNLITYSLYPTWFYTLNLFTIFPLVCISFWLFLILILTFWFWAFPFAEVDDFSGAFPATSPWAEWSPSVDRDTASQHKEEDEQLHADQVNTELNIISIQVIRLHRWYHIKAILLNSIELWLFSDWPYITCNIIVQIVTRVFILHIFRFELFCS